MEPNTHNIDWSAFEGSANYVKIKVGKPKKLTCDSVSQTLADIQEKMPDGTTAVKKVPTLLFHVTVEDGEKVDKEFSVTSKLLAKKLRPFIEKGFPFSVTIYSSGERFEREYDVVPA